MGRAAMIHQFISSTATSLSRRTDAFRKDEGGALIIFALMLLMLMLMMGGLALDLMKGETTRVNLAQTADRASLAAAALSQTLDPEAVARDYMLKAGLSDQLRNITVVNGGNYRSVQITGLADTHPLFMHLLGIDHFDVGARSKAEQGLNNIEISLVLDVSGSMTGAKIAALKVAAGQFVDTVFAQDTDHRVSVSIVPYNAQVNLPVSLRDEFNVTDVNGVANVNCAELPTSVYNAAAIPLTTALPMMAYADIAYGTNKTTSFVATTDTNYAVPNFGSSFCKPTTVNLVRLPSDDPTTLKAQINALQAGGNTSITLGMKWGLTMLDPSLRGAYANLISAGDMAGTQVGRPYDYNDARVMKVVVLMTDGEHVSHTRIADGFKTGAAPIYKGADGNYSVYFASGRPAVAGTNEYWVPHLGTWQATAWTGGGSAVQQDWKTVWASLKTSYVAWQFYARALGTTSSTRNTVYNSTMAAMVQTYEDVTTMDSHLQSSCQQAKDAGVVVYGIAVEAPTHGQDVIRACASSSGHYYDADSSTLAAAFGSIATNITQLKLTQ
jgi:hypothetical protein